MNFFKNRRETSFSVISYLTRGLKPLRLYQKKGYFTKDPKFCAIFLRANTSLKSYLEQVT